MTLTDYDFATWFLTVAALGFILGALWKFAKRLF